MKALIETTLKRKDKLKAIAKKRKITIKELTAFILDEAIKDFESGDLVIVGRKIEVLKKGVE